VALCRTGFSLITCAASQLFFNITPILGEILRARSAVAKATQLAAIMDNDDFVLVERRGECFFLVSKWHPSADLCAKDGEPEQGNDNVLSGMVSPNSLDKSELIPVVTTEELERIRSWLSPTEFESEGSEYRKHLSAHSPGTGDWLFHTDQYREWHDSGTGTLWIQGIPGSGKSVVAANLIGTLKNENAPVLFFFARRIIKSNSDPQQLVRDCLYQFLNYSIALGVKLKKLMEQEPVAGRLPVHELCRILLSALSTVPKVYVLLDALDELAVEKDDFLRCLLELGQKKPSSIKLILTSRPLPHLQTVLKGSFLANLRLTGRKVEEDIAKYITYRMANQQERVLTTEEQLSIQDVLCQKGQGLFLYTRLMLGEILEQSTSVLTLLQHLPSSLEDMYVDLLHEHSSRSGASLHFQSFLLSWVTHSSRPLRITELAALINSEGDRGGLTGHQDTKLMVRTSCGPLLEILDDETIQVIHHSFTEFLLNSSRISAKETTGSEKWFPTFTPAFVHRSLTLSCIDYLLSSCFEPWSVNERPTTINSSMLEQQRRAMVRFQFLQYAAQNLLYHAVKHDALDVDLISKFDRFFQYGSHDFESWKDFLFAKKEETTLLTPDRFYPLHVAAQAGLTSYIVHILRKVEDPDLLDGHSRTAVAYAAMHGHAETVAALLDQKASFAINDNDGLQPIHHAAKGNHVKALRCLLNAGADPMAPKAREYKNYYSWDASTMGKTPMQYACEQGNSNVVSELLQRLGSDLRSSVLPHWASAKGQAKVLSILLQHPEILANINKKDICGNTSLYLAARAKDSATIRILLHYGADVHSKSDDLVNSMDEQVGSKPTSSGNGRTALQGWANFRRQARGADQSSFEEWETTGRLLMEAGGDVEARDETGRPVLFAWTEQLIVHRGDTTRMDRFVSLLLEYGANPSATDNSGNTVLHQHRMWDQYPNVIRLLTRAGANINHARDGDLVTPLIFAAKAQCVDCNTYIENGAHPNMQDSDGNTALHHISRSWLFELKHVQEWLKFADPTIKNNKGETCLYNLRFGNGGHGRVKAIPFFVEKGVDLESRNRLGRTALLAACQNAQPHFITGLVQNGANTRSKDFQNKSCK